MTGSACIVRNISRVRSPSSADLFGHVEPAEAGHPDVEHRDVGRRAANHVERRGPVADRGDHLHVGLRLHDLLQTMAKNRMVVGDDDANVELPWLSRAGPICNSHR